MSRGFIYISKVDMTLTLINSHGQTVSVYPMACGRVRGQKQRRGDNRTPEGHFTLQNIQDASTWGHDFNDGKGFIPHAYGPWFLRLYTGFKGIGIHGTHAPESIGTRASEGCIRLKNEDLKVLRTKVTVGMPVIIGPEAGVKSLISARIPAPTQAGPNGLTGSNPAPAKPSAQPQQPAPKPAAPLTSPQKGEVKPEQPAAKPVVKPAEPKKEVKAVEVMPIEPAGVKVVGNQLDVAPETDVVIELPAPSQPVETVTEIETKTEPAETAAADSATPSTAVEAKEAAAVDSQTVADSQTAVSEPQEAQAESQQIADEPQNNTQTAASAGEPRYEVVVEEVTGPDGEVKYEVRYKLVE